ncbi:MAG: AAA family ATPase [Chloroflexota bacterium]|nr:AAA family ATPase [Chloroflexota bacterium]
MEMRAYIDGIVRKWWLIGLVIALCWWLGGQISDSMTSQYSASTSVLLNDHVLAANAFPAQIVQLTIPTSYQGVVMSPGALAHITKTYPRLPYAALQKNISVEVDTTSQLMIIKVSDVSPFATADIANFLTRYFVDSQTADLSKQLTYYSQWLQPNVSRLSNEINSLNQRIDAATPAHPAHGPLVLTPTQQKSINEMEYERDQDERALFNYNQSLKEVQQALPLVPQMYVILKPATIPDIPITSPPGTTTIRLATLGGGLLVIICLLIIVDFLTPAIRHRGELLRIIGVSPLTETPQLSQFEQRRLLQSRRIPFMGRIKSLRLLSASVSATALKSQGAHTVLLTTPHKKWRFAAPFAMFLANKGHKTLLIDADFDHPTLHAQLPSAGPLNTTTPSGRLLSFVNRTTQPNLFLLPATATLAQNQRFTTQGLLDLLPDLQSMFDLIIIDAPPFDTSATHIFVTRAAQVLVFVKKRRDHLQQVKMLRTTCERLKLHPQYVLLS